ncbi:MAG: aminodeoxychorismate lyase [Sulfuricella sp.]|nr:aminodeoxychorismate lyase [Sulfuricella sp.]
MVLVNGLATESVRIFDRGLTYGDGVFRTLPVRAGRPLCWRLHYDKLCADCAALGIECPPEDRLIGEVGRVIEASPDCVLKIIVTRGEGLRGYAVTAGAEPTRILTTSPLPQYPATWFADGIRMHLCSTRLAIQPRLAGVKHLNRLENVLARREWTDPAIAEGLLLDMGGNVIEGTMSNLLILQGTTLLTPDLSRCGVAGVQRARIMALAGELGLAAKVENLSLAQLQEADEVALCNSVIGAWQVRELAGKVWRGGSLATRLRKLLDDRTH